MLKTNCRLCKSENLVEFLDLGHHPHSDNFRKDRDLPEITYPLTLNQCQECQFVQLGYTVSPDMLYDNDYLYESSITQTANAHWESMVNDIVDKTGISKGLVFDIGGNDGTLSLKFKEKGFSALNIEPCTQIADISTSRGVQTANVFFDGTFTATEKADIIVGTNVFAHIDDLDGVMDAVKNNLNENGVFVFESPYLGDFIQKVEYDTVYHQHLSYLAVAPLVRFLKTHGMDIFDITFSDIHGGCFRCFITRKGEREINPIVQEISEKESFTLNVLHTFAKNVEQDRFDLIGILQDYKRDGRTIVGVSSPAKGMTLLNYTGAGKYLDFVTDKSKLKQGRYTPGSHLLIKSDEDVPDGAVCLLLAWNFSAEIIKNNPKIKTWIIPIPHPHIYEA